MRVSLFATAVAAAVLMVMVVTVVGQHDHGHSHSHGHDHGHDHGHAHDHSGHDHDHSGHDHSGHDHSHGGDEDAEAEEQDGYVHRVHSMQKTADGSVVTEIVSETRSPDEDAAAEIASRAAHSHSHGHDHGHDDHSHDDHGHDHSHDDHGHDHGHDDHSHDDHGHDDHGHDDHGHDDHGHDDHSHDDHSHDDHSHDDHSHDDHSHDDHGHDDHGHVHDDHGHSHGHSHSHSHAGGQLEKVAQSRFFAWIRSMSPARAALFGTFMSSCASLFCVLLLPFVQGERDAKTGVSLLQDVMVSFAVGGLLGDVFLHLIPHAFEAIEASHDHGEDGVHDHSESNKIGLMVLAGITFFFIVEKVIQHYVGGDGGDGHGHSHGMSAMASGVSRGGAHSHSDDESSDHDSDAELEAHVRALERVSPSSTVRQRKRTAAERIEVTRELAAVKREARTGSGTQGGIRPIAYLNLIADAVHNFSDGMAVGAAFLISHEVGLTTSLAVFLHELPQEVGDYCILVAAGMTRAQALLMNFLSALVAMLGTLLVIWIGAAVQESVRFILPFAAGGFIYIAMSDIVPELHASRGLKAAVTQVVCIGAGVAMSMLIAVLE